jgi:threonine synthase
MGVYGTYKGAKELRAIGEIDRVPKLLCAQQESCAPLVHAYNDGSAAIEEKHIVRRPHGIAEAILRGDPSRVYPYVKSIVTESGGDCVAVTEAEIREARTMTEELEGISPCFSASTAVAGLMKQVKRGRFPCKETVLVNLTGGDRPRTPAAESVRWLRREGDGWAEERPRN